MENVPGMLSVQKMNIADVVKANFEAVGYACTYALVNADWFGVPQNRTRLILRVFGRIRGLKTEGWGSAPDPGIF
jgi:site-specific DNA-cytosine methylase